MQQLTDSLLERRMLDLVTGEATFLTPADPGATEPVPSAVIGFLRGLNRQRVYLARAPRPARPLA